MKKVYTGIDVGSREIKIVVSELIDGKFHVLASTVVRSKGVKKGFIQDVEAVAQSLLLAKKEIEEMLGVEIDQAVVTVPTEGIEFNIVEGMVSVENEEHKIGSNEVISVLQDAVLGRVQEHYELVTVVPISFQIDDGEGIRDPKGFMGTKLSCKAVISSIPRTNLKPILSVMKQAGIEVIDIAYGALGDYYEAHNKEIDGKVSALINIGYDTTEVSIFNKGIMIKCERLPIGSRSVDKDISIAYRTSRKYASYLKEHFAVSNTRYASSNDVMEITNQYDEKSIITQLEISEVVEARIVDLLKLAKKQINLLTNREISYIIITGGISELAGFQYVVENVFERNASTLNITEMGIRNNMYSSASGILKYFHYKLELRGKTYSMFNDKKAEELISTKKKFSGLTNDNIIRKVFGYFSGI